MQTGAAAQNLDHSSDPPSDTPSGLAPLKSWDSVRIEAKATLKPIVVLVEQRHCGFCQRAKAERLRPASRVGEYAGKAIFVSLATDLDEPLIEKGGLMIPTSEFAEIYEASFTPTVLFLDYQGNEVQERMVGYLGSAAESAIFEARLSAAITTATE